MFAVFDTLRKPLRLLILPFVAFALAACEPGLMTNTGSSKGPKVDTSKPIPVALLVPRGGSASDNLLAQELENAARLAIRDLAGVQIDLRVYGTGGSAALAATAASQAVNEGAQIIVGPLYGEAANAAGNAVAAQGVNVLSFSNNASIAGGNVFVMGQGFDDTSSRLVRFAKATGKDKILVLHSNDVAGQLGRNAIMNAIAQNGATSAGAVDYSLSQESVIAAVPRVKAAVEANGANAIFLTTSSASALPLFAQLLPEAGVLTTSTQYIGLTRWDIPAQTLALPGVQGGWFAMPDPSATAAFSQRYSAAYGKTPGPIAGLAFDGIAAVGALARSGKSNALSTANLTQGAGFRGANGVFRLKTDGTTEHGLAIATVRNNSVVIIDPAPQGFGGAGF
ncbi:penicillin-binding protein activator [Sulfitobacter sp. HGT1]|uniref:penicillin-binding protein activator n=1 Tax=Sulfitobacter sp. HGT1 TaxID=2735435 RepID=UPI0015939C29|nr:penicillin-binding protein activator [Sulfitobacter sp. HGT1]